MAAARSACGAQLGRRALREPDDPLVVAEVVVPQLRVAVEAEAAHDDPVEGADEEVGQVVRARLVAVERAGEELVAVRALEPRVAVESAARAAVRVGDDDVVVARRARRPRRRSARDGCAARAAAPHVEVQPAPPAIALHVQRQGPAGDDDPRHAGNES